jgi:rhodanese-related sulfurtransferase
MMTKALSLIATLAIGCAGPPMAARMPRVAPVPQPTSAPAFLVLSEHEAWSAHQASVMFLDARPRMDFMQGHIPGAVSLPLRDRDFEDRLWEFLASPRCKPNAPVVVYCSGCCSTDAVFLALRLQEVGFKQIKHYKDGFPGWARADHPISRDSLR